MRKQIKNLLMGIVVGAMIVPAQIMYAQESITKIVINDIDSGTTERIKGFEYEIEDKDGKKKPFKKNDDGQSTITLVDGKYKLIETKRPNNYLPAKTGEFELPQYNETGRVDELVITPKHYKEEPKPKPEPKPTPNEPPTPPYHEGEIKIITHDPEPEPTPTPEPEPEPTPTPEPEPQPTPEPTPTPKPTPEPKKDETPEPTPQPTPKQEKFTKTGFTDSKVFDIIQIALLGGILVLLIKDRTAKKK